MKDELLAILEELYGGLEALHSELEAIKSTHVSRVSTQETMKSICRTWFDEVKQYEATI